jgi:uncharacterized protein YbjT (DUF2867 family)
MTSKNAVVFGASGLIGSLLLKELIRDNRYSTITLFLRKSLSTQHLKVKEIVGDFSNPEKLMNDLSGDDVFCCLGTTIKKAGSQDAFRKIDYELPVLIGNVAKKKAIENLFVVSSLGADPTSSNFYLKTKGEMETTLTQMNFKGLKFFRPSMLLGDRSESRPMETLGKVIMKGLGFLFVGGLKKYKAIHAKTVALCMIKAANTPGSKTVFESDEIESFIK